MITYQLTDAEYQAVTETLAVAFVRIDGAQLMRNAMTFLGRKVPNAG